MALPLIYPLVWHNLKIYKGNSALLFQKFTAKKTALHEKYRTIALLASNGAHSTWVLCDGAWLSNKDGLRVIAENFVRTLRSEAQAVTRKLSEYYEDIELAILVSLASLGQEESCIQVPGDWKSSRADFSIVLHRLRTQKLPADQLVYSITGGAGIICSMQVVNEANSREL